jgi:hypothetical protein
MSFRPWHEQEESWLEWCIDCVDFYVERSAANQAMMAEHQNPDVQTSTEFQYYVNRHGMRSDYRKRTHDELIGDVNVLHDFTRRLVKEKNQMQRAVSKAEQQVQWANYKIWALTIFLAGEGAVIGWLVNEFFQRMK